MQVFLRARLQVRVGSELAELECQVTCVDGELSAPDEKIICSREMYDAVISVFLSVLSFTALLGGLLVHLSQKLTHIKLRDGLVVPASPLEREGRVAGPGCPDWHPRGTSFGARLTGWHLTSDLYTACSM